MKCAYCGGHVTWRGPLSNLTHTQCDGCQRVNCQEVDQFDYDEGDEDVQMLMDRDMGD